MADYIVGLVFFAIIAFGVYYTIKGMKNNSCPGCSGGCSADQRKQCDHN